MRTFNDIQTLHPKALLQKEVFAAYYHDGGQEEWVYFKMIPRHVVRYVAKAMQQMKMFASYALNHKQEECRTGFICERWELRVFQRDEALMPLQDFEMITAELVASMGYELHWIPVQKMLNMKNNWI